MLRSPGPFRLVSEGVPRGTISGCSHNLTDWPGRVDNLLLLQFVSYSNQPPAVRLEAHTRSMLCVVRTTQR